MRLTTPAVIFLSLGGIMAALLYALKRFTYPAFMAAIFNLGIVVITLGFQARLSITAMALGWLIGSVAQVLLMLPGLRDARFRPSLMLRHPALRQIVALYLPILGGLVVEMIIRTVSYRLATETGVGGVSWMQYATTLRQLPQGLVGNAVSFAILPTLAVLAVRSRDGGDVEPYRAALARGLKLVIVLIIPATVGLMILGRPTVDLLFEHGSFTPHDTLMTTLALYFYLFGLPFAAIDLLLVFSFYARQDTLTPALIGVGTNIAYLIVMLLLLRPLGLFSLMVADSFKQLLHAAVSAYILRRHVGGLAGHNVLRTAAITLLGAGVMAFVTWLTLRGIDSLFSVESGLADVLDVLVPGAVGGVAYLGLVSALRVEEITLLFDALRRRFLPS
jgi:putative peptidoglycan lipid II flippase